MDITKIKSPTDIKELNEDELVVLAEDIRSFLIENISKTGGHLSSNLGVVELTIALHYIFDSPNDRIFFDVGHQSYIHKILTGRANQFVSLRKTDGLSGFQKLHESPHDVWEAGHSSTSLSAAVAMAVSRDLDGQNYEVLPVIGDAAMVGGEALEALNHLGTLNNKVIVILNDNQMAIGKSVGGVSNFLSDIRMSKAYNSLKDEYRGFFTKGKWRKVVYRFTKKIKDFIKLGVIKKPIFHDFGIEYLGPVDGHNFHDLFRVLELAKKSKESVIVHVVTTKGKGYPYAERDIDGSWHGIGPFDIATGVAKTKIENGYCSWSSFVAKHVQKHMRHDKDIVTITPAMIHGSCLDKLFEAYPKRCFDVGIAEEHALTFMAGLSLQGKKPFLSIYSSFLQRAYDQMNHDVARMNLPCLVVVDRAGLVGADGPTHHGVFDISMLYPIPNLVIFAPKDAKEAGAFINTAFLHFDYPYVMRVTRNMVENTNVDITDTLSIGSWTIEMNPEQYDLTIVCYGDNVNKVKSLFSAYSSNIRVINARFIKPMDEAVLHLLASDEKPLLVYETDLKTNGLASNMASYYMQKGIIKKMHCIGIEEHYTPQGSMDDLYALEKIDEKSLLITVEEILHGKGKN